MGSKKIARGRANGRDPGSAPNTDTALKGSQNLLLNSLVSYGYQARNSLSPLCLHLQGICFRPAAPSKAKTRPGAAEAAVGMRFSTKVSGADWINRDPLPCSRMWEYNGESVFNTFPWPQSPAKKYIAEVAAAAVALRGLRREIMAKLKYSLRQLYRTLEEPGANPLRDAQARLDSAVRAAYGMPDSADPLTFLLDLNLALAAKEAARQKITPPGLPLPDSGRPAFITDDCIRVTEP